MKYIIFICSILQWWSYNSKAQTTNKTVKIDAFSVELGMLIADEYRIGYAIGLASRADRHLFQLQVYMDRELFFDFEWQPDRAPLPAKIVATNSLSLMYGYSILKMSNFQLTPSIGLVGGRELYRTSEYDEIVGIFWNTYTYYHQLNDFLGVSGAMKAEGQYRNFGVFSQLQLNYYGRTTVAFSFGVAFYPYRRKPRI